MKKVQLFIKRLFDIIVSFVAILVLSPILLIVAVAIKLDSKGPVMFLQERLGYKGKKFKIIKFRTMMVNAEHIGEGLRVSSDKDPRITKVGRFLRATSIDELPQFFNILCGSMSLVGPRPPVTYHPYKGYEGYPEWAKKRFEMRPGVTGLVQATVRNSVVWDERIKIDNQYIDTFSLWNDFKIILMTVKRVCGGKNVYGVSHKPVAESGTEKEKIVK